ncbi:hypothetical protein [Sinomonas albida]|uniref:hypothetical protein n=1 Tax=Sinomonas albida TaxID=369942 RepID=UPI003017B8E1
MKFEGHRVERTRRCLENPEHRFRTYEEAQPLKMEAIAVRQSGSNKLAGAFEFPRLVRDIEDAVLQMGGPESALIADRVAHQTVYWLERKLDRLMKGLSLGERRDFPLLAGWIYDHHISDQVEIELGRTKLPLARVLYALSIRGRDDREGRHGWRTAKDVLNWLYDHHPRLKKSFPLEVAVPEDAWYPTSEAPLPKYVIKKGQRIVVPAESKAGSTSSKLRSARSKASGDHPESAGNPGHALPHALEWTNDSRLLRRFDLDQFVGSIRKAMMGRANSDDLSKLVAQRVLHDLGGQPIVLTSQLAAGVLDCLRRTDDIAYLRWVSIAKSFDNVPVFEEEARALVSSPSRRLVFRRPQTAPAQ